MQKRKVLWACWLCLFSWGLAAHEAHAQDPAAKPIYFPYRKFKIPFKNDEKDANFAEVRLYASSDQGRTWKFATAVAPEVQGFRFSAEQDGYYCFAVQTVDSQGKFHPRRTEDLCPILHVVVDSTPPKVLLKVLPARGNKVGVAWKVATITSIEHCPMP